MNGNLLLISIIVIAIQAVFAGRNRVGGAATAIVVTLCLAAVGVVGLMVPFMNWDCLPGSSIPTRAYKIGFLVLILGSAFLSFAPAVLVTILRKISRSTLGKLALVAAISTVIPFGILELAARYYTDSGDLEYFKPMTTQMVAGSEDWRMAHITADEFREPDPILLWRPVTRAPYNIQGFKGPVVEVPKPANVIRIMTYGDSNTDGPAVGGWPEQLQALLNQRFEHSQTKYEVINAGVTGYSSYQGLMRFHYDVGTFKPDLVLVSFGWNDLPSALGQPDKDFRPPRRTVARLIRGLVQYRSYLVLKALLAGTAKAPATQGLVTPTVVDSGNPRVALPDYVHNLRSFVEEAHANGAEVVLLTRPHRLPETEMRKEASWRKHVPDYNDGLRDFAAQNGLIMIDAEKIFETKYPHLFADECHFTAEGYQQMASVLTDSLNERKLLEPQTLLERARLSWPKSP